MSLFSGLTQVLAPYAAKINGLLTGWDGTKYKTPGEAVRRQITDLHVLIGDVPGEAIQASAVAYNGSNVSAELTNVNGRLNDLTLESDYQNSHYDITSKNLFNKATAVFGKKVNASTGAIEDSADTNFISQKIAIKPSTAYYVNRNGCLYDESGTFLEFHNISGGSNFTTPATASYIIITSTNTLLDASMVAEGTSVSFDAYTEAIKKQLVRTDGTLTDGNLPANALSTGMKIAETKSDLQESIDSILNAVLDLKSLSGEIITINDSAVDYCKSIDTEASALYRCGVNIWNEEWELGTYANDGTPSSSATTIRSKNDSPVPIKPSTEYYIITPYNVSVLYYRSDGTFISYEVVNASSKVFTTPNNAYLLRFRCVSNYGTTYNNDIQIALNSDPDKVTYHAHTTQQVSDVSALKIIPNDRNYIYAVASDDSVAVEYYVTKAERGGKKPYESGFIVFSVPSRLTKSNNTVSANALSEGSDDSVDVNCILKLPTSYTPNGIPTKLIMICHGAGQSAQQWSTNANYNALVDAFVNAGYAVFDCNGYRENVLGYSFWGDFRGVDVWRKAYQYVVDNYNVEHQFGLYGFSMGGLTALNLMFSGFPGIKCVALGSPVVNLEACYNSESVNAVIKTLYGMGDTYNPALAYGCDPYSRIITISDNKYIFGRIPPLKMWYGSTETGTTDTGTGEVVTGVVVKAYGEDIVNAINRAGGQAEYREVANAGHEICYGGNAVVNSDLVLYFNRHCL
jgi:predicted esterase